MSRLRIVVGAIGILVVAAIALAGRAPVFAQAPVPPRAESGDAAVAALVAEVRALRADLAAASRDQLRAQLLLGRVQMQEQRLAYLDKQRADTATALAVQSQMTSACAPGSATVTARDVKSCPLPTRGVTAKSTSQRTSNNSQTRKPASNNCATRRAS